MLNNVSIMGRITKDPELKTAGETQVINFSVACDRDFGSKDGEKQTDFIECVAWGHTAAFLGKWFHKGDMLGLTGRIQVRPWEDKDGNKRRTTEVICEHVYFAGSKNSGGSEPAPAAPNTAAEAASAFADIQESDDGDLPF